MDDVWEPDLIFDCQEHNNNHETYVRKLNAARKRRGHKFEKRDDRSLGLIAGDYYLTARNKQTGQEYVVMVIERKTCTDLWRSITEESLTYNKHLTRIDVQMRKLYSVGENVIKLLLLEGHENKCKWYPIDGRATKIKAVKTFRKRFQTEGYYPGMKCVQTRDLNHTIEFICDQLDAIKRLFVNQNQMRAIVQQAPSPQELKENVRAAMSDDPIFTRYLDLVKQPRIGCVKAMNTIKAENPRVDFICPRHIYYGKYVKKGELGHLKCNDIASQEHMPTFYDREDFVSAFFVGAANKRARYAPAVARAACTLPVEPTVRKRQHHYQGYQSSSQAGTRASPHTVIDLRSDDDEEEAKQPARYKRRIFSPSTNTASHINGDAGFWTCRHCTFSNRKPKAPVCEMCRRERKNSVER